MPEVVESYAGKSCFFEQRLERAISQVVGINYISGLCSEYQVTLHGDVVSFL